MNKAETLEELPKLQPEERGELLERLQELAERDLLAGIGITVEEAAFLEREWREFETNREAGNKLLSRFGQRGDLALEHLQLFASRFSQIVIRLKP